jgi:predicted DNA-binding transcriptional regulator YafY
MNCLRNVIYGCTLMTMARANDAEKAERLNHARGLLRRFDSLPDAVNRMVRDCSVSPRQAYRYLQQAGRLKQDLPVADAKIAFTVKLSEGLVERLRSYASKRGLSLSDIVSRALETFLPRSKKRG